MDGAARIEFKATPDGRTVLSDLYQRAPCRILFPLPESDEIDQAVLLTTSGGLTGGDRIRIEVDVQTGARATVTAQAAEKLYRAAAGEADTRIGIEITVAARAWAEWLSQETILFDGSRLRRGLDVSIAAQGRLLAAETLIFGRTAMGERFETGLLHDQWRIRRDGRLVWADALHLETPVGERRRAPFGFGTAVACSTLVYIGEDAATQLEGVRRLLRERPGSSGTTAAATSFDGLLLVRVLAGDAAELRSLVAALIGAIRHCAAGLPPRVPRVWHC